MTSLKPDSAGLVERHKRFNAWYAENFRDPDGSFKHLPTWHKTDVRLAWDAASSNSAALIEELRGKYEDVASSNFSLEVALEATESEVSALKQAILRLEEEINNIEYGRTDWKSRVLAAYEDAAKISETGEWTPDGDDPYCGKQIASAIRAAPVNVKGE